LTKIGGDAAKGKMSGGVARLQWAVPKRKSEKVTLDALEGKENNQKMARANKKDQLHMFAHALQLTKTRRGYKGTKKKTRLVEGVKMTKKKTVLLTKENGTGGPDSLKSSNVRRQKGKKKRRKKPEPEK